MLGIIHCHTYSTSKDLSAEADDTDGVLGAATQAGTWLAVRSTPSASYNVLPSRTTILQACPASLKEQGRAARTRN